MIRLFFSGSSTPARAGINLSTLFPPKSARGIIQSSLLTLTENPNADWEYNPIFVVPESDGGSHTTGTKYRQELMTRLKILFLADHITETKELAY